MTPVRHCLACVLVVSVLLNAYFFVGTLPRHPASLDSAGSLGQQQQPVAGGGGGAPGSDAAEETAAPSSQHPKRSRGGEVPSSARRAGGSGRAR